MAAIRNTKGLRICFNLVLPLTKFRAGIRLHGVERRIYQGRGNFSPVGQIIRGMSQAISVVLIRAVRHFRPIVRGLEGPYRSGSTVHPGNWRITTPSLVIAKSSE